MDSVLSEEDGREEAKVVATRGLQKSPTLSLVRGWAGALILAAGRGASLCKKTDKLIFRTRRRRRCSLRK